MNNPVKGKAGPLKVGITGGVGSGKSVVCDYLLRRGFTVVSADDLARRAVEPGTEAYRNIMDYFGDSAVSEDKNLDRKKLRRMISQNPDKKKMLESFIHPEVFRLMDVEFQAAAERGEPAVVVEVPLLFELGLKQLFDLTVTICADRETRIQRMMKRDGVSYEDALSLLEIQMPDAEKIKQSDFVIENNGSKEELAVNLDGFYKKFMRRIQSAENTKMSKMG